MEVTLATVTRGRSPRPGDALGEEMREINTLGVTLREQRLGAMEATTLMTAFLICVHVSPTSLEAMWKYLIMCSVGVAFAFIGTLLVAADARKAADDFARGHRITPGLRFTDDETLDE